MCTASHNPKAYTGAKLVERGRGGAVAATAASRTSAQLLEDGLADAPGGGSSEDVDVYAEFQDAALRVHRRRRDQAARSCSTAATAWPARWSARSSSGSRPRRSSPPTGSPTASSPTTSRTRCCPRTARSSSPRSSRRAPTSASPGTATPTAASSSTTPASSSTATSSPRCWPSRSCRSARARTSSTTSAPRGRSPTPSRRPAARAHVNRVGHAFFKTRMRDEGGVFGGEVSGHYYFADFYNADSGTIPALLILELLGQKGADAVGAARAATARSTSSRARSTPRSPTRQAKMQRSRSATPTATQSRARRHLGRLRRLALQRAARPTPSRCCG